MAWDYSNQTAWLDWLTVFGYVGFTVFIAWQVIRSQRS